MKVALVTGAAGQDGWYLSELFVKKEYVVYGLVRYSSVSRKVPLGVNIVYGDVTDASCINSIITTLSNDKKWSVIEVYNLAAQSHVRVSFDQPEWTTRVDALGPINILESIRQTKDKRFKFYQAGTSEMFGKVQEVPQSELTPFYPRSPYGCAKVYAYWITKNYREAYGMFACTGILFNHESERRGEEFVTRKITKAIGRREFPIRLGNLDATRDWGYAPDYVEAMWMMLQTDSPDDFVVATGETHSVREFVEKAFEHIGIGLKWDGPYGRNILTNELLVTSDPTMYRPTEVDALIGDSSKFRTISGWKPKVSFDNLVQRMVDADVLTSII
jgi:GDPmannose 4,6-dehydratase